MPVGADERWDRRRPACMELLCESTICLGESMISAHPYVKNWKQAGRLRSQRDFQQRP